MRDTSKPLRAGDLKHTVTVLAPAGTHATETADYNVAERVPAAIQVVPPQFQARESLGLGGVQSQTEYQVTLRWREDLLPAYALVEECCTARRFQIVAIIPSDRRDALDLKCVTNG